MAHCEICRCEVSPEKDGPLCPVCRRSMFNPSPSDYDFPCSETWRGFYNQQCGLPGAHYRTGKEQVEQEPLDTDGLVPLREKVEQLARQVRYLGTRRIAVPVTTVTAKPGMPTFADKGIE